MHILFLADTIDNQNAGVYFYIKNLIETLFEIEKTLDPIKKNRYSFIHNKQNSFFNNTEHYIIKSTPGYGRESLRRFIKIPKLIKKLKPDIVIEPCHIGPFNLPKSIKRVTIIHDLTTVIFPKFHIKKSVIIHRLLLGKVIKNASLLITPSQNTKNDILRLYKTNTKIKVIPEGISSPNLEATEPTKTGLAKITNPYILYLGTIEPRKNLDTLIDTFLDLKNSHNLPHQLVLAGGIGWKIKPLLDRLKGHQNDIVLTGYVSEKQKASLYKHADIFIYPSLYEGFGLPPLEAMSYGIPVICSTGGSLKEIFSKHALMFDPTDKETLKTHILNLCHSTVEIKQQTQESQKFASTFTWDKTAREFIKALQSL